MFCAAGRAPARPDVDEIGPALERRQAEWRAVSAKKKLDAAEAGERKEIQP